MNTLVVKGCLNSLSTSINEPYKYRHYVCAHARIKVTEGTCGIKGGCKATALKRLLTGEVIIKGEHNHEPEPFRKPFQGFKKAVKTARELGVKSFDAFHNNAQRFPNGCKHKQYNTMLRQIVRYGFDGFRIKEVKEMQALHDEIDGKPRPQNKAKGNFKSIHIETGKFTETGVKEDAVLIYNDQLMARLASKKGKKFQLFFDGTYDARPRVNGVQHLLTFVLVLEDVAYSCAWVLASCKTTSMYEAIFRAFKERHPDIYFESIMTDFEDAMANAFLKVYVDAKALKCYFHYAQCITKKTAPILSALKNEKDPDYCKRPLGSLDIVDNEVVAIHREGAPPTINAFAEAKHIINLLISLACLPAGDIKDGFKYVKEQCPGHLAPYFQETFRFYEDYWMQRVTPAVFSVYGNSYTTNNHCEGYHAHFNDELRKNPSVLTFCRGIAKYTGVGQTTFDTLEIHPHYPNAKKVGVFIKDTIRKRLTMSYVGGKISMEKFLVDLCKLVGNLHQKSDYTDNLREQVNQIVLGCAADTVSDNVWDTQNYSNDEGLLEEPNVTKVPKAIETDQSSHGQEDYEVTDHSSSFTIQIDEMRQESQERCPISNDDDKQDTQTTANALSSPICIEAMTNPLLVEKLIASVRSPGNFAETPTNKALTSTTRSSQELIRREPIKKPLQLGKIQANLRACLQDTSNLANLSQSNTLLAVTITKPTRICTEVIKPPLKKVRAKIRGPGKRVKSSLTSALPVAAKTVPRPVSQANITGPEKFASSSTNQTLRTVCSGLKCQPLQLSKIQTNILRPGKFASSATNQTLRTITNSTPSNVHTGLKSQPLQLSKMQANIPAPAKFASSTTNQTLRTITNSTPSNIVLTSPALKLGKIQAQVQGPGNLAEPSTTKALPVAQNAVPRIIHIDQMCQIVQPLQLGKIQTKVRSPRTGNLAKLSTSATPDVNNNASRLFNLNQEIQLPSTSRLLQWSLIETDERLTPRQIRKRRRQEATDDYENLDPKSLELSV